MEKSLPTHVPHTHPPPSPPRRLCYLLLPLLCLTALFYHHPVLSRLPTSSHHATTKHQCQQMDPLFPKFSPSLQQKYDSISTPAFRNASIARLSAAVQIPTETFDDLGKIGEDSRWEIMFQFQEFLRQTFPLVHERMQPEVVNTHGLLFTWTGSDESLKPLLLMAHQDVVPVPAATVKSWTHPPFSGFYDGKFIWGRGASDCKNQLIAVMETMELLIEGGFEPKRTIVLSFGFDEEKSGPEGAGHLAPALLERYGKEGIAAVVDEGAGFVEAWGSVFATPGTGEKGYTDVEITIRMPGGHSSIPSPHTSIGVLSALITDIESAEYPTFLSEENPYLEHLQCGAAHAPDFPKKLDKLLQHRSTHKTCKSKPDYLAIEAAKQSLGTKYLMQTSQAVTVISGGVKVNALPERTTVTVNHRINIGDTAETIYHRLTQLAKPIAEKHNLTLHAFDGTPEAPNSISLSPGPNSLHYAPTTPTSLDKTTPYAILAATTRALYGTNITVSPGIMTGNTDTRFYWALSRHIFRFAPGYDSTIEPGLGNIHTVDERVSVEGHLGMVRWFWGWVGNMDGVDLED